MTESAIRPRFKLHSRANVEEIRRRIKVSLLDPVQNPLGLQHRSAGSHLLVVFPRVERHFWSPVLDISLEAQANGGTQLRLLMGPEPSIWTLFMFMYTLGGLAATLGLILGYAQWSLGKAAYWLWLIPAGLLLMTLFYLAAWAGRRKARKQMNLLQSFLKNAIQ